MIALLSLPLAFMTTPAPYRGAACVALRAPSILAVPSCAVHINFSRRPDLPLLLATKSASSLALIAQPSSFAMIPPLVLPTPALGFIALATMTALFALLANTAVKSLLIAAGKSLLDSAARLEGVRNSILRYVGLKPAFAYAGGFSSLSLAPPSAYQQRTDGLGAGYRAVFVTSAVNATSDDA